MKAKWNSLASKSKNTIIGFIFLMVFTAVVTLAGIHERGTYHVGAELFVFLFGLVALYLYYKES